DGITFDSKQEAERSRILQLLERAGEIHNLETQPKFTLVPAFTENAGQKQRAVTYRADFKYTDTDGATVVEDVKGHTTEAFRIKWRLLNYLLRGDNVRLEIVT